MILVIALIALHILRKFSAMYNYIILYENVIEEASKP